MNELEELYYKVDLDHKYQVVLNAVKTLKIATPKMVAKFLGTTLKSTSLAITQLIGIEYVEVRFEDTCPLSGKITSFYKVTKWGEKYGEIITNPKVAMVSPLLYRAEYRLEYDYFTAQYRAKKGPEIYNTELKVFPGGKMKFSCECWDFMNNKMMKDPCKHIENLREQLIKGKEIEYSNYWKVICGG